VSAALLSLALPAGAHNLAPAYLELRERAGGEVEVLWKQSSLTPRGVRLEPALPCPATGAPVARDEGDAIVLEWRIACRASLVGQRVAIAGLAGSGTDAIVRLALADGREVRAILTAKASSLAVPARESTRAVLVDYARLGITHLWTGLDHLLFVAGLGLLLGATRRLAVAVTAFTAGHSVTLALAALGLVRVPQAAVEVAIAATIVALALSLARTHASANGRAAALGIARRPALLPFAFGLLHGLGFAAALGALGLPRHAIPLALFAFNLGIELGQLALVAALLAVAFAFTRSRALTRAPTRHAALAREAATTAIGALGVFWCLDRAASWLFP
jgi:hydrogenase/urease accessory protein HupE